MPARSRAACRRARRRCGRSGARSAWQTSSPTSRRAPPRRVPAARFSKTSWKRSGAATRRRSRRWTPTPAAPPRADLALQAARHELLAIVAFQLLVARLLVAVLHARLLCRLSLAWLIAFQAGAHELLALVALLVAGALVAGLHPLLLLLLRRARFLLLLGVGAGRGESEAHCCDQQSHGDSSVSRRSMAVTSFASFGSTRVPKLCTRSPRRSTRYLWKFQRGAWPVAFARSP